jgi:hypothetical protein
MVSTTETAATPKSQRRRRAATGGFKQKLDAPQRKGFVRRWVDNDPSRIIAMEDLGYALVAEKAGEEEARTDGLGSRIQRHAGKRDNGSPQALVLMECRAEDYAQGEREKEDQLKPFEDAIRAGQSTTGPIQDGYEPANRSTIAHERERA